MLHNLPNLLTIARLLLAIPVSIGILYKNYSPACILLSLALLTDFLDGFLARKFLWESNVGAVLDPLADKILLTSCYLSLFIINIIPLWVVFIIVIRDVILLSTALYYNKLIFNIKISPTALGKLTTFLQMVLAILVLLQQYFFSQYNIALHFFFLIIILLTLLSGMQYFLLFRSFMTNIKN